MVFVKMGNLLLRRGDIIALKKMLQKDWFQPRDSTEQITQDKYDVTGIEVNNFFTLKTKTNLPTMYRADLSFTVLKYIGMWRPQFISRKFMYNVFSFCTVFITYIFTISTLMYLFRGNPDMEEFTESFFFVLALVAASVKIENLFIKRGEILKLTDMLLDGRYSPRDFVELCIQKKFDRISRIGTITYLVLGGITIIIKAAAPLTKGVNVGLPYKAWVPYNLENRLFFWLTYLLQAVGSFSAGEATIAIDTFVMVMMLQLCAQLEILMHRIQIYPQLCTQKQSHNPQKQEKILLGMWVQHHESTYIFGDKLNEIYSFVFLFQLFATTIDVCTSTYLLSTLSVTSAKFWTMICSLLSILFQISLYCWHGHKVAEKSKAVGYAAYSLDWTLLSNDSRINIIHIMRRSTRPITFTAGWFATISIETFTAILRMSYSIYSVLMQSSRCN